MNFTKRVIDVKNESTICPYCENDLQIHSNERDSTGNYYVEWWQQCFDSDNKQFMISSEEVTYNLSTKRSCIGSCKIGN